MSPTDQRIITAMLVLLCYPSQVTFASVTQCTETNSIANRVLVGHAFFTKQSPDIEDCVISCITRDPLCESTNYYRETKVCELNDKNAESNPDDLVDYEWAIYMTNSVRLLRCNNFDYECERQTDICQIKRGGNKCEACYKSLGMENGKIPPSAITASSYIAKLYPNLARLNLHSAWAVGGHRSPQWLQIDLGRIMAVKMIASQGRPLLSHNQWVKSYEISSRVDGFDWVTYMENNAVKVFQGNTDKITVVSHVFPQHIRARYIRIWPKTWKNRISMRVELYGCYIE